MRQVGFFGGVGLPRLGDIVVSGLALFVGEAVPCRTALFSEPVSNLWERACLRKERH